MHACIFNSISSNLLLISAFCEAEMPPPLCAALIAEAANLGAPPQKPRGRKPKAKAEGEPADAPKGERGREMGRERGKPMRKVRQNLAAAALPERQRRRLAPRQRQKRKQERHERRVLAKQRQRRRPRLSQQSES